MGERFLAVDVHAGAKGGNGGNGVPVIGGGDADRVDVIAGDDVFVVIGGDALVVEAVLGVVLVDGFPGVVAAVGVDVADGDDFGAVTEKVPEEAAVLFAHADEAHREGLELGLFGGLEAAREDEGCDGGTGGGLDEFAAGGIHGLRI